MSLAFRIAFAAYARGTHHKLAMHALTRLTTADHDKWLRLFVAHAETFAIASKKPDDTYKDFKNHVLHPRDGYWGGAVTAARQWYATLVEHLKARAWPEAVEAAGVLSHYLADPLQPFHTAQSEAENTIHRACEWSINRCYDELYAAGATARPDYVRRLGRDPNWLARLVCESADLSNVHYETLIAHYSITRGVVDPPAGLDAVSRALCAELLVTAAATIAAVFDHAIEEAGVAAPDVTLTAATVLALIKVPRNMLLKRIENADERRAIEAIYDELRTTGEVVKALPDESRTIRDLYAAEVTANRSRPAVAKLYPLPAPDVHYELPRPVVASGRAPDAVPVVTPVPRAEGGARVPLTAVAANVSERAEGRNDKSNSGSTKPRLSLEADVVDAPSIGPKTAARLAEYGVQTVGHLLAADPAALAVKLAQRHITATTIGDWQAQASLVVAVPGLTGGAAQLLVGAGYRTAAALASANVETVCANVAAFAATTEGHRMLRDGAAPDAARIANWHARAQTEQAA